MNHRFLITAAASLVLAAAPAAAQARPLAFPDDHSFIVNATHSNLAEIAAAKLALRTSDSATVKSYARTMIADHTKAQAKLSAIAKAWSTTVPSAPSAVQKREAAKLDALSGDAFDRAYLRRQVVDHRKALATMLLEADTGRVAALRGFAATTSTVVAMHLAMAKEARADIG